MFSYMLQRLGESKLNAMTESKDFRAGTRSLKWEKEKLAMETDDLKAKWTEIQQTKVNFKFPFPVALFGNAKACNCILMFLYSSPRRVDRHCTLPQTRTGQSRRLRTTPSWTRPRRLRTSTCRGRRRNWTRTCEIWYRRNIDLRLIVW
jgi:hypothetical protein